jgi:hypothetical protein
VKERILQILMIINLSTVLSGGNAFAQGSLEEDSMIDDTIITRAHQRLSSGVEFLSRELDTLLADDPVETEVNKSQVVLRVTPRYEDQEDTKIENEIKSRLVLPKTERRFNVLIQNVEDSVFDDTGSPVAETASDEDDIPEGEPEESDFSAALRFQAIEDNIDWLNLDAGVKFRTPLDPFSRIGSKQATKLSSSWELDTLQEIQWFKSTDMTYKTGADLIWEIHRDLWLRQANRARWTDEREMIEIQNGFSLTQAYPFNRSVTYYVSLFSESEPTYLAKSYTAGIRFKTDLFEEWIKFELNPYQSWRKDQSFDPRPGVITRISIIFGHI